MPSPTLATLRLLRGWAAPPPLPFPDALPPGLVGEITTRAIPGVEGPVRVLEAGPALEGRRTWGAGAGRPPPGWVVLHGMTVLGLEHPSLLRFVRALAASGARVVVPEILPWTRLELAPAEARRLLSATILQMTEREDLHPGGVGVAGFSFGGPQALLAAGDPSLRGHVRKILAWGSYARFPSALHFAFTGDHGGGDHGGGAPGGGEVGAGEVGAGGDGTGTSEPVSRRTGWSGDAETPPQRIEPDPYARWIAGANLLPGVEAPPGEAEANRAVARVLAVLAHRWGREELDPAGPAFPAVRDQLRAELPAPARPVFDLFVPPRGVHPDPEGAAAMVQALGRVARMAHPLLDPVPDLGELHAPVHLIHGRADDLIPWTETRRLAALLAGRAPAVHATLTDLFAHSNDAGAAGGGDPAGGSAPAGEVGQGRPAAPAGRPTRSSRLAEGLRFAAATRRVLALD